MNFDQLNKTFLISFIIGLSFTSIGLILSLNGLSNLGTAFFFFLPLAIGISSGILPEPKQAVWGTLVSLAIFSIFLALTEIEGLVCILMALPILLGAILIGWLIGRAVKKNFKQDEPNLKTSFSPILIFFIANFFEIFSGATMIPAAVSTTVTLDATPNQVYKAIIAVDTVDVETHFLQKIGLPTPRKCVLTEEKVGGLRICEFEEGQIIETIKEFKKDEYLRMEVTTCELGDRSWLRFNEDIYNIEALKNGKTAITRTTSYFSNLKPRKYWAFMEAITIKAEQDFVFRNLKKDVKQ